MRTVNPTFKSHTLTETFANLQKEVQRKLGRNLIRLQQYELLMKGLVTERETSGSLEEQQTIRKTPSDDVTDKSLGIVKQKLMGGLIQQVKQESSSEQEEEIPDGVALPWFRTSYSIVMSSERYAYAEAQLSELVSLRNELVHHFLERFDLASENGCHAADVYLDERFRQINEHFEQLLQWARHLSEARETMARFMAMPEFEDFFVQGILKGGAGVNWPISTIVQLLQDAENALGKDGWTLLKDAIEWIRAREPVQTPKKYGCSSWRQVIHKSGQFRIRKVKSNTSNFTEVFYCSRA